jgi:hypothetical protein
MKRRRIPRPIRVPTLVALHLAPEVELTERFALDAFLQGRAQSNDYNVLADVRDLLMLAASEKNDRDVIAACELAGIALLNIKDRHAKTKRFGCTADERAALMALVDVSDDFWRIQGGGLYHDANKALDKARGFQREVPCR